MSRPLDALLWPRNRTPNDTATADDFYAIDVPSTQLSQHHQLLLLVLSCTELYRTHRYMVATSLRSQYAMPMCRSTQRGAGLSGYGWLVCSAPLNGVEGRPLTPTLRATNTDPAKPSAA